jgi:hypothetical protein
LAAPCASCSHGSRTQTTTRKATRLAKPVPKRIVKNPVEKSAGFFLARRGLAYPRGYVLNFNYDQFLGETYVLTSDVLKLQQSNLDRLWRSH